MSPLLVLAVCAGGGVGAAARLVVDGVVRRHARGPLPWGTVVVNVTGSFLLGLLTGLAAARAVDPVLPAVLGTGLCGGYTTFSTAVVEVVRLAQRGSWAAAVVSAVGGLVLTTAAAALGLLLGGVL